LLWLAKDILEYKMTVEKLSVGDIMDFLAEAPEVASETSVLLHESLPSTNDFLLDLIQQKVPLKPKTVVIAEVQTAGKGRQGRAWVSPAGNIYLSLYRPFHCALDQLYGLSLVAGLAVGRVIQNYGLHNVKLKWPNDIFWDERKMGGILIETKQNKEIIDAVIGIGLNIQDIDNYQGQISQQAVSLEIALQQKVSRSKLIAQLLIELNGVLNHFADYGFEAFVEECKSFELQQEVA
jgi:BirA family biotin operon repressor/biotin-[acetyl-CoA-carboxylase] ligase